MTENIKKHVTASIRSLMKPIILLLLRNGVTYKEFATLSKSIFVEASLEEFGLRGRPTNVSRISVLTGIDRKEVKRIKDELYSNDVATSSARSMDRFSRILSAWHQNSEYIDDGGQPRLLAIEGELGTFRALVRRYGGDVPMKAVLVEMIRLKLAEMEDEKVRVLQRDYFPAQNDPSALLRASSVIAELSDTLYHNLYIANPERPGLRKILKFERRASNNLMDIKHKKTFYKKLEKEAQAFLESMDSWMAEREIDASLSEEDALKSKSTLRFSVGLFGFDKEIGAKSDIDESAEE